MSFPPVPELPAGHIHLPSVRILLNDEEDGTQETYWIHSFASLMTGETRRVFPIKIVNFARDLEDRGALPIFGGRS
jgi:hypothetical protein